ncbi:DUF308 domain-containing protein [Fibrivirga algicola]|uniref:DUF308 domain-containing protein n=1 Tax=Fibrivirga algicola TaxID=2950420 RepID=A0ABX0QLH1_9BACT|nr:DUF308 domain-containing protein [Fibrivirga algicola]NID11872.1 hypothetical protein [Fibrivirga algicola]
MNNPQQLRNGWMLTARGVFYILMGGALFLFANSFSPASGRIVGVLTLLAGLVGFGYGFTNRQADANNIWSLLHGLNDLAFGLVFIFSAASGLKSFVDMLGFWAIFFAFLQSVQAMYVALMQGGSSLAAKVIHFLIVLTTGYMAFDILLRPIGLFDSLGITGFFPIVLGILIIVLQRLSQRAKEAGSVAR